MLTRRLALGAVLMFALVARAEDPPKPPADAKPPADPKPDAPKPDDGDKPADPPKSKPGSSILNPNKDKPKTQSVGQSYTDKEYDALREPKGTPGYKADSSDLKPGQTVRLYLSKGSAKDDKVVVTTVMIVADAPKTSDSNSDTPKKKKKE